MSRVLADNEIEALLKQPERKPRKAKKLERNYDTWFKVETHFDECSNGNCVAPDAPKRQMVGTVEGIVMCRWCFLDGHGSPEISP